MGSGRLTVPDVDPAAAEVIGGYLAVLAHGLPAGLRYRARVLAEVADGLACAVLDQDDAHAAPAVAASRAAAGFGDPRELARAFARQRCPLVASRVGLGLVSTGPVVGSAWVAAYATGEVGFLTRVAGLLSMSPLLVWILAVTVPAAVIAATGVGWAARVLRVPAQAVTAAALVAAIGCLAADTGLLLTALLGPRLRDAGSVLIVVAVAASVVRLIAAGWAGCRLAGCARRADSGGEPP